MPHKNPIRIPNLRFHHFTGGIQNNHPVVGMRSFSQEVNFWHQ